MDRREKTRAALRRAQRQLENAKSKREATIKLLIRLDTKTIPGLEQAVRRIGKRIDKIDSEAFKAVASKEAPVQKPSPIEPVSANQTDDGIPAALRRTPKVKAQTASVTLAELPATDAGKANAKSWEAIPAVRKRKARRSPDDFKAEMDARGKGA
jgi:sugar-specific transcriptional regulator TrmB